MKSGSGNSGDASLESASNFRKKRKKRNNPVGRPNCLDRERLGRLLEAYYTHPYSFRELADMFGVSRMTVWRAVQEQAAPAAMGGAR